MAILGLFINQINRTKKINLGDEIYTFSEVEADQWKITGGEYWIRGYDQGYRLNEIEYIGSNPLVTSEINVKLYLDAINEDGDEFEETIFSYNESYDDQRVYEKGDVIIGGGATGQLTNKKNNFIFGQIYLEVNYRTNGNKRTNKIEIPLKQQE